MVKNDFLIKWKKLHPEAQLPVRAKTGDGGLDVRSLYDVIIEPWGDHVFPLGWSVAVPHGWGMFIIEKSGRAVNDKVDVGATLVDSGYRGEVHAQLFNNSSKPIVIEKGEKIAQAVVKPIWVGSFTVVEELDETDRGDGKFGSTGLK